MEMGYGFLDFCVCVNVNFYGFVSCVCFKKRSISFYVIYPHPKNIADDKKKTITIKARGKYNFYDAIKW